MSTNGASDETIAAYAAQLIDIDAEIEDWQVQKKDIYANARETYGKRFADSLKLAIKRHRMDSDKREAADEIDAEAERMLSVIRAPRATHPRTREIIEEIPDHDPETGEVNEAIQSSALISPTAQMQAVADVQVPFIGDDRAPSADRSEGIDSGQTIPEPASPYPETAEPGDRSAVPSPAAPVVAANVVLIKKRPTFNDPPHRDCLDPERCGGFSNLKLCQRCSEAADQGQVA